MQVSENVFYNCVSQLLVCRQALACGKLLSVKELSLPKVFSFLQMLGKCDFKDTKITECMRKKDNYNGYLNFLAFIIMHLWHNIYICLQI
jgi:hypothetical protein